MARLPRTKKAERGAATDTPAETRPITRTRPTSTAHSRKLTILAQDPSVRTQETKSLLFVQVDVPAEDLAAGPTGYRVKLVDYDATAGLLYCARARYCSPEGEFVDPFERGHVDGIEEPNEAYERRLLSDPNFHAQNVYGIAMRTLTRFERALGRRVAWGFGDHQLHIAPHAFCEANAFYSKADRALMFGYFVGVSGEVVQTCLSHDVVAHETTHALLDGLRNRFTDVSLPDQAALHEGFSDVVALLSMFSLPEVVAFALDPAGAPKPNGTIRTIAPERLAPETLRETILFGIGKEVGRELDGMRGKALRRSLELTPDRAWITSEAFQEEHRRGEILAAAMMHSFLALWRRRIEALGVFEGRGYNLDAVINEGATVADHLLTMAIRALDYCPPTDIDFPSYLAALLTADAEVVPDDSRYGYRTTLRATFAAFGIDAPDAVRVLANGQWRPFASDVPISYARSNFESMLRDPEEVFQFIWNNRDALSIYESGDIAVASVRPSQRIGPDGFMLRETVCEYVQTVEIFGAETKRFLDTVRPAGMPPTQSIRAYGGGVLIFDQYGRIKFHVANPLRDGPRQLRRLVHLYGDRADDRSADGRHFRFADLHRARAAEDKDVERS